jgi:hypothetical protein
MTLRPCPRQTEVRQLVTSGHWPHACPPELRAHLDGCRSCAGLLLVTQTFQASRATLSAQAKLPAAGAIWWRAQLRRRNAAVERLSRPLLGAYVFALAVTVLVASIALVSQARAGLHWLNWLPQSQSVAARIEALNPIALLGSGGAFAVLIAILGTLALAGALAVYFAAERQ